MMSLLGALAIGALATSGTCAAAEPGFVDFGKFTQTAGGDFVEVNVKSNLIAMAVNLAKQSQPEVAEVLAGLKQVRVNVLGLTPENQEGIRKRVADIRTELDNAGWERVVSVAQKGQDVGVFVKMRSAEAVEGLVVTVLEGKRQAVLVNIVGDIRPDKLAVVGERFNIEPLKKLGLKPAKQ